MEIAVAMCADRNILPGLHVTLGSAVAHLRPGAVLRFFLFHHGICELDLQRLRETMELAGPGARLEAREIDPHPFGDLRGIHGNVMTYARLCLPDWLPDFRRVIYLDSDLIVRADLADIVSIPTEGVLLAAVEDGCFKAAADRVVYEMLALDLAAPFFNAGVLILNLAEFRKRGLKTQAFELLRAHRRLRAADEAALNILCHPGKFARLPTYMNQLCWPSLRRKGDYAFGIFHLAGSPKPWDLLGDRLNVHSREFFQELDRTAIERWRPNEEITLRRLATTLRKARQYVKVMRSGR